MSELVPLEVELSVEVVVAPVVLELPLEESPEPVELTLSPDEVESPELGLLSVPLELALL